VDDDTKKGKCQGGGEKEGKGGTGKLDGLRRGLGPLAERGAQWAAVDAESPFC
jgi:hypothetical protein